MAFYSKRNVFSRHLMVVLTTQCKVAAARTQFTSCSIKYSLCRVNAYKISMPELQWLGDKSIWQISVDVGLNPGWFLSSLLTFLIFIFYSPSPPLTLLPPPLSSLPPSLSLFLPSFSLSPQFHSPPSTLLHPILLQVRHHIRNASWKL